MSTERIHQVTGYLSIAVGICAAMCIYRFSFMFYGLGLALLGFILSGTNIFLGTRHELDGEGFAKGYIGMFLSSLPVLFMMYNIFLRK